MNRALALAREYGVAIRFADLGDWGADELRSEYEPGGPSICINERVLAAIAVPELGEFITLAVGHELYHHRERLGEVPRLPERPQREHAAERYARALLAAS